MLGDYDKTMTLDRTHIWSINDRMPHWQRGRMTGTQIPVTIRGGAAFKITVGDTPEGAETEVRIGFKDPDFVEANLPQIFVNSERCTFVGTSDNTRADVGKVFRFAVPKTAHKSNVFIYIISKELVTVDYLEAYIKAPRQ